MNNLKAIVKEYKSSIGICILFLVISFIFLFFNALSTSPLYHIYKGDSVIFLTLGKFFLAGKIPYVDFFDHKGPMLIFIEALGLQFHPDNRTSIFILGVFNLTFILLLIFGLSRLFLNRANSMLVVLLGLLVFSFTFQFGNLSEEYSLPFLLLTVFFTIRAIQQNTVRLKSYELFLIGICLAITFWIRVNNAGAICACILCLSILYLKEKNYSELVRFFAWGFAGFGLVSAAIILYFIKIGAFDDMMYATFLFNLKYAIIHQASESDLWLDRLILKEKIRDFVIAWFSFVVLAIGAILVYRKTKNQKALCLSVILLIVGYLSTHITTTRYHHYMMLNIPLFTLGVIYIMISLKKIPSKYILLSFVAGLLCLLSIHRYIKRKDETDEQTVQEAKYIANRIPEDEKTSVWGVNITPTLWLMSDLMPCYKYYVFQEWHARHDRQIELDINNMLDTRPPLWIITDNEAKISGNKHLLKTLEKDYVLQDKTEEFLLYRKIEN